MDSRLHGNDGKGGIGVICGIQYADVVRKMDSRLRGNDKVGGDEQ